MGKSEDESINKLTRHCHHFLCNNSYEQEHYDSEMNLIFKIQLLMQTLGVAFTSNF